MATSSVMLSLPQMVDLALNSPEVGAVNFNILHSVMHVLIQQTDLLDCKVEFKGQDSERLQAMIASGKPGPTLNLTEYIVTPGKNQAKVIEKKTKYTKAKQLNEGGSKQELILEHEMKVIDADKRPASLDSGGSMHTVVVVESSEGPTTPHVSVALSRAHFNNMEDEIDKLKVEVRELKELPANMGLIDALRNADVNKSSPLLDMFQILTLSKRIDATETSIGKLGSMVEDLARSGSKDLYSRRPIRSDGETRKDSGHSGGSGYQKVNQSNSKRSASAQSDNRTAGTATGEVSFGSFPAAGEKFAIGISESKAQLLTQLESRIGKLEEEVSELFENSKSDTLHEKEAVVAEEEKKAEVQATRLCNLEGKFTEYTEQVSMLDTMFNEQINMLQNQFNDLEKEIGEIIERINVGAPAEDTSSNQNISELYNKIVQIQEDMEHVTAATAKLMEEKEDRQFNTEAILEQIELLKTIKANREDLEDALADKADACAMNRKVSHDQFDAACDDLARGIEDALQKLTQQEELWQQALDDIQKEIGNKLDKMELTPLRDFVNNKLKTLQERLKALTALKKETEAAGTKSKLLRNVNCISCDKDVTMRKELDTALMAPAPALPPTKSIAPYLAYELDALRRQKKCMPHGRNLNHFEIAMSGKGKGDEDHICNRYCGGSHTVTTPQQRVARLGHFLQQWGPDNQALNESQMMGTDGQMYKIRESGDAGRRPTVEDSADDYHPSMKARPSMTVQGDILSARTGRPEPGKPGEEGRSSSVPKEQPPSVQGLEHRRSSASQRKVSQQMSTGGGSARGSKQLKEESKLSVAKGSRSSLQKAQGSTASITKTATSQSTVPKGPSSNLTVSKSQDSQGNLQKAQTSHASVKQDSASGTDVAAEPAADVEAAHPEGVETTEDVEPAVQGGNANLEPIEEVPAEAEQEAAE